MQDKMEYNVQKTQRLSRESMRWDGERKIDVLKLTHCYVQVQCIIVVLFQLQSNALQLLMLTRCLTTCWPPSRPSTTRPTTSRRLVPTVTWSATSQSNQRSNIRWRIPQRRWHTDFRLSFFCFISCWLAVAAAALLRHCWVYWQRNVSSRCLHFCCANICTGDIFYHQRIHQACIKQKKDQFQAAATQHISWA